MLNAGTTLEMQIPHPTGVRISCAVPHAYCIHVSAIQNIYVANIYINKNVVNGCLFMYMLVKGGAHFA